MRKKLFVFTAFLMLACNLNRVPSTVVLSTPVPSTPVKATSDQVDSQAVETLTPASQIPAATAASTSAPIEIADVPSSAIQIGGIAYTAYQIPGDPFRIVCQDPCSLDQRYIFAEYAGFRAAHAMLIELTGVDILAELQPVDMHLDFEDSVCEVAPYGHAYVYSDVHQAFTCTDGPGVYTDLEEKIRMAAQPVAQYFPLHEYMHTLFFGRISGTAGNFQAPRAYFFHDYVVQIPSYAIGILDRAGFCTYRDMPPGDYGGYLINELCQQNGFQLKDLATSLIELDHLYQSGGGQVEQEEYQHPAPTVAQYRDILSSILGSDTTGAFAAACWPPELFGNSYSPAPGCAQPETSGTATPIK